MATEQKQIDELRARIDTLERERWSGPPRLGPRPASQEDIDRTTKELVDAVKCAVPPVDRANLCTTSGEPVAKVRAEQTEETGQHKGYIVLCEDERNKGFVRPYRDRYKHLTCGCVTAMGRSLSETYARDPNFYSHTFCVKCNRHLPVAEFIWTADDQPVGS